MKILVNWLFIILVTLSSSFGCDLFTKPNISELQSDIRNGYLTLKQNTIFPIIVDGSIDFLTTDILYNRIETDGISILFESKSIEECLEKYLGIISRDPCFYDDRSILFVDKAKDYTMHSIFRGDKMVINITVIDHEYINDFGYSEHTYIYTFQKINDQVILVEINFAG